MKFADSTDIKRAETLSINALAVNSSPMEIARTKASSMANSIKDKRKILGRLEAVSSVWNDYSVLHPFIERCIILWPNSQYSVAYHEGNKQGLYLKTSLRQMGIPRDFLINKYMINNESGVLINGDPYEFDEVARIIFNTLLKRRSVW